MPGRAQERKPVHEDITYGEIYSSMDHLWNFMFFTGYFRKEGERMEDRDCGVLRKLVQIILRYFLLPVNVSGRKYKLIN